MWVEPVCQRARGRLAGRGRSSARALLSWIIVIFIGIGAAGTVRAQSAISPLAATEQAIADLESLQSTFPELAPRLQRIIDHLEASIGGEPAGDDDSDASSDGGDAASEPIFVDSCHVARHPRGRIAFDEARQAVEGIDSLLRQTPPAFAAATLREVRGALVEVYFFLADVALQEARALGRGSSAAVHIRNAERELERARAHLATGRFGSAMQSFRQAWQQAQLAIPAPTLGEHPHLNIQTPEDGSVLATTPITVAGTVQLTTAGTVGPDDVTVTINGVAATVAHRSYQASPIPLRGGLNAIVGVARDAQGDVGTTCIAVQLDTTAQPRLVKVAGDAQSAAISSELPQPLRVKLLGTGGQPVVGRAVIFRVVEGNGFLDGGQRGVVASSNGAGEAEVRYTLGSRAGVGVNRVRVTAEGFSGEAIFSAVAAGGVPESIDVVTGDAQMGGAGQPLALPLVVVVTDAGMNPVAGVPVTFTLTRGSGSLAGGGSSAVAPTNVDGRASVSLTLGLEPGLDNHIVEATFDGLALAPAVFQASTFLLGSPADTRISGVVHDNQGEPVPGTRLFLRGTTVSTFADEQGLFTLTGVPVGHVFLEVDPSTTTRPGTWAALEFEMDPLPGVDNRLPKPIYILPLDLASGKVAGGAEDVTVTVPDVPGFSMTVLANSATFPNGDRTGLVSVTAVHADKIPMAPGSGMQPRFIVTIQPANTHFNPPAPVTFPNSDGLPPGTVTEMFSFDHDLGEFVSIGTGTVSEDGLIIRSDPGFGIVKAGWHCAAPRSRNGSCQTLAVQITTPDAVAAASDTVFATADPVLLCRGNAFPSQRLLRATGTPSRDVTYSWEIDDTRVAVLSPAGSPLCTNQPQCNTTATVNQGGAATATVRLISTTTGASVSDTVRILAPHLEVTSISPANELALGADLTIEYEISASGEAALDSAELRIVNVHGTVVYRQAVDESSGVYTAVWPAGKWNEAPHAGAFANPKNGPYTVVLAGRKNGAECLQNDRTIRTKLVVEADIHDRIPTGATATEAAGLDDMLDALKVVFLSGITETVFAGSSSAITIFGPDRFERHIQVDDPLLSTLADGEYFVDFRDLRDEIGNFADDDNNPANGIQPVSFTLSLW